MKIYASVYADTHRLSIKTLARLLEDGQLDYLYFDATDRSSIFEDIEEVRRYSQRPICLHLSVADSLEYLKIIQRLKIQRVSFQYEALGAEAILPLSEETQFGLSISTSTSVEVLNKYVERCKFVLLRSEAATQPKELSKEEIRRIHEIRRLFPAQQIEVICNLNNESLFIGRLLGVYAMISASFLSTDLDLAASMLQLRSPLLRTNYLVRDLMIPRDLTPQLSIAYATDLQEVMQSIETQGLGFVCYTHPETGQFLGLSSNADIRRGILKYFHQLPQLNWQQLCNKEPFTLSPRVGRWR